MRNGCKCVFLHIFKKYSLLSFFYRFGYVYKGWKESTKLGALLYSTIGLRKVYTINKKVSHVVFFWLINALEAYIVEFVVKGTHSYSASEWDLFKGPRGRYMRLFPTCIKNDVV